MFFGGRVRVLQFLELGFGTAAVGVGLLGQRAVGAPDLVLCGPGIQSEFLKRAGHRPVGGRSALTPPSVGLVDLEGEPPTEVAGGHLVLAEHDVGRGGFEREKHPRVEGDRHVALGEVEGGYEAVEVGVLDEPLVDRREVGSDLGVAAESAVDVAPLVASVDGREQPVAEVEHRTDQQRRGRPEADP